MCKGGPNNVVSVRWWWQCSAYADGIKEIVMLCFQMYVSEYVFGDQIVGKSEILSNGSDLIIQLVSP